MRADKVRLLIMQANPPGSVTLGTAVEERKSQEVLPKSRQWADLGVGEAALGRLVAQRQRALDQAWAAEAARIR